MTTPTATSPAAPRAPETSRDVETVRVPTLVLQPAAPASFAQEQLWLVHRLEGGSQAYHIFRAFALSGLLLVPALERALGEIVRRHQALRTVFRDVGGRPEQVVAPFRGFPLPVEDLAALGESARAAEVRRRTAAEAARPFDLAAGPLFRAGLLRLGADEHVLMLAMHHVVSDGWSMGILYGELSELYAAFAEGGAAALPEPTVQYTDYALWQREQLRGAALERLLAYWKARLAGAPAMLELPTDHPRPAVQSHRGHEVRAVLPAGLPDRLREVGRGEGATLFMVLLAAFQVLLARYAGSRDVVVGTPVAERPDPEVEGLIGFFVNTVALRTDLSGDPTFREVVRRVCAGAVEAYDHQELPFQKVVEELAPERTLSYSPVVQVSFAVDAAGAPEPRLRGVRARALEVPHPFARYDLEVLAAKGAEGWSLRALYRTDLFARSTAERMLAHLGRVLEQVARRPDARLSELELLADGERRALVEAWSPANAWRAAEPCIHQRIQAQAARTPDAVALVHESGTLTCAQLEARANRLAHRLRRLGVGPEVCVGVCVERGPELVVCILAVLRAGGAYVPLDPAYPAERIAYILRDSAVSLLLVGGAAGAMAPAGTRVLRIEALAGAPEEPEHPPAGEVHPESAAYVVYTSGSTGRPKGVVVSHAAASAHFAAAAAAYGLSPADRMLVFSAISFDPSLEQILAPLSVGASLAFRGAEVWSPAELADAVERLGITVANPPTAYWHALAADAPARRRVRARLRLMLAGGEALRPASVGAWHGDPGAAELLNVYGPAETVVTATLHRTRPEDGGAARVPVGTALSGRAPRVLDERMRPVPDGLPGELYLGGAALARGYQGRPALTAERFVPDPYAPVPGARMYRTGDGARLLPEGGLDVLGRTDEQVKIRGHRIEPGEVEAALRAEPGVEECAVVAREDAPGEKRLVAYVVGPAGAQALRARLGRTLPEYMMPAAFVPLDALPLSPNGKVDRRALPAPDPAPEERYVAPRTPVEEVLAEIWAQLLGRERVGAADGFFPLGGHSLLATRVVSRVREVFGVELPLRALFEAPTLAEFARRVEEARRAGLPVLPPIEAAERAGPPPLSFAQERLWFLDRLEGARADYGVPAALRLSGRLDVAALERALGEVVRRHQALRTTFAEVNGEPVQAIAPFAGFSLAVEDLSGGAAGDRAARVQRRLAKEAARPFDLAAGPLFRARLLRAAEDDHVLLVSMHHAVSDGWSVGVLFRELSALYAAFRQGRESPLPELPVQYGDYAAWQREQLRGEALERLLGWWKERLAGAPALLELPADRPRPAVQTHRGARVSFRLAAGLVERLHALGRGEGATPFMVLLGAFQVLLSRYAGSADVVVGSPIAGRTRREVEELIGFFANTLVLRTELGGDPPFREVLRRVREGMLGAYEHQDVPFEKLVAELQPERSLSHSPLFQVVFLLQDGSGAAGFPGLQARGVEIPRESTKFDLALSLAPDENGMAGVLAYAADLFDAATIERMARHLERVLEQVAADPDRRLSRLSLLDAAERRLVVEEWNRTNAPYPADRCIHQLFAAQAARTPDAVAAVHDAESITYRQLNERANRLAHHLRARGVGPEARAGVCLERGLDLLAALLAVMKAGGAYVPLDPAYPAERLALTLADAGIAALVTQERLRARVPVAAGVPVVSVDGAAAEIARESAANPASGVAPGNLAYLIYTSGSTGVPKGVAIEHGSTVALLAWAGRIHPADELAGMLASTSICFDLSVYELFLPLCRGGRVILVPDALSLPSAPAAGEVRLVNTVPSAIAALLRSGGIPSGVTTVNLAGEPLRTELVDALYAAGVRRVHDLYGPSEDTTYSTWTLRRAGAPATIGGPIANTRAYVLDAALQPVPAGVPGELYLGGRGLARGYLGRPGLTAERFVPDPFGREAGGRLYRTGDRVRRRADGALEYLGRLDAQVKVRGYRIEPGEVEAVLRRHPGVRECAVVAREDAPGDRRLAAYVVGGADAEALRAHLRRTLPEYMLPAAFVALDALPLTPNGKLDRPALPAPDPEAARAAYVAPRTPVEAALAAIWAEVLRLERVGVNDDFFHLGGHSLLATRVVARIRESLEGDVGVASLFEHHTIGGLAPLLAERTASSAPAVGLASSPQRLLVKLDQLSDHDLDILLGLNPENRTLP